MMREIETLTVPEKRLRYMSIAIETRKIARKYSTGDMGLIEFMSETHEQFERLKRLLAVRAVRGNVKESE